MKKSLAMKWVNALRSGKYKQGKDKLFNADTNEYCCLGVLDKMCGGKNIKIKCNALDKDTVGLQSRVGLIKEFDVSLASLNDNGYVSHEGTVDSLTFDEIADIIQINYKEL